MKPVLQVALDLVDLDRALGIAELAVAGGADWIEAGTPLIKSEGIRAVTALAKQFPSHPIVADMKVADTGTIEVEMAAKAGAAIVCVLGDADDAVIRESVRAAEKYGARIMADLINTQDPLSRAVQLQEMGVHIINAHTGIDQQMTGIDPLSLVRDLCGLVTIPVAVAGGLDVSLAAEAVRAGSSVIIVGGSIVRSADVVGLTRQIKAAIDDPSITPTVTASPKEDILSLLLQVTSSHVSDAMHRKGAMKGIWALNQKTRAVGPAITVQTFAGDWAKPVEAIDTAEEGDVLVINNDQGIHVAPFGELAVLSCINKKIAGVIIDGAVRDVTEIRSLNYPVFVRATVPNAGEPKGMGEIGTEILCGGRTVRTGDWIVADDSGVVVIPKKDAYEIARRAIEVKKTESRIREEIAEGKTLGDVMHLLRWEKH
ncbi:MAG: orotidine 5'-phosphate decarboxylase [Methanospirillaceae archaeon]|nr:orotidine 5'-phosphate decarboxylase [Methanospirillaceae archaeon]